MSHVAKTVRACFAALRQLRSVRRSVPRPVLQSLVSSLVLSRLDYSNGSLVSIPLCQLERLQSVINSSARMVFSSSRFDHITPLLRQLHRLKVPERIDYKLALLVYKCLQGVAPSYLADDLCRGSKSSAFGLVTVSGCAPYAAVDVRRPSFPGCHLASLEQSATSRYVCTVTACFLQSSEDSSPQPQFSFTILLCLRSDTRHYGHFNRCSYLLTYLLTYHYSSDCYCRQWAIGLLNEGSLSGSQN